MRLLEPADGVATCVGTCAAAAFAAAIGLPVVDLAAGITGAFFGLAFTPPVHWGKWLDVPTNVPHWMSVLYWARRIVMVAFILAAVTVVMTGLAQVIHLFPLMGWWAEIKTPLRALLLCSVGQYVLPRGLKLIGRFIDNKERAP